MPSLDELLAAGKSAADQYTGGSGQSASSGSGMPPQTVASGPAGPSAFGGRGFTAAQWAAMQDRARNSAAHGTPGQTAAEGGATDASYQTWDPSGSGVSAPPGYEPPPLGFPMSNLPLKLVQTDEYGKMYADQRGFVWRGPEFRPRYDTLKAADPIAAGGWVVAPGNNWFHSLHTVPEYTPSASSTAGQYAGDFFGGAAQSGASAASMAKTLGIIALAGGALYVAAPMLRKL